MVNYADWLPPGVTDSQAFSSRRPENDFGRCEISHNSCLVTNQTSDLKKIAAAQSQGMELLKLDGKPFDLKNATLADSRAKLGHAVQGFMGSAEFTRLTGLIERRAGERGLTAASIAKTYAEINRIATAAGDHPLQTRERQTLIKQFMQHLGERAPVSTGMTDTCGWGVLQLRMMWHCPEVLARGVADVATTGATTLPNGRRIEIDTESLRPDRNARSGNEKNRDYFNQVAQVALISTLWATRTTDPEGNRVPIGSMRFKQLTNPVGADLGGRVYIDAKGTRKMFGNEQNSIGGTSYLSDLDKVYALWSGRKQLPFTIYGSDVDLSGFDGTKAESAKELGELLHLARAVGDFPLAVNLYDRKSPMREDYLAGMPHMKEPPDGWHSVALTQIEKVGKRDYVTFYNPWGYLKTIPLEQLFEAMRE